MINYFEAAEKTLRARGLLETALGNLERKKERILRYGAPSEYPSADMSKPYTGAKSVNDALADCLELAEVIVHHKIELTPRNIDDPAIALGEDMTVYTVVIAFYFGTQTQKISDAVDKTLKGE